MTTKQLKSKLATAQKAKKAEIKALLEKKKIELELVKLQSPLYLERALNDQDNATLDALLEHVENNYAVDGRKLTQVFGYGVTVGKILTLLKAIQYSKYEEKQELLMMTGLTEQIVEDTMDALGNTTYFSVRNMELIPEQRPDIQALIELIKQVSMDIGLVGMINTHKINKENIDRMYQSARIKAEEMLENTIKFNIDNEKEMVYEE